MKKYNFVIMDESKRQKVKSVYHDTEYIPGEDTIDVLIYNARCKEERDYLIEKKERLAEFGFAFNMLYVCKMACGHYEVFQVYAKDEEDALSWVKFSEDDAKTRKCTRCICNWEVR